MSNPNTNTSSIYDVYIHVFKDIQTDHYCSLEMAKESVLHKTVIVLKRVNSGPTFSPRFGPYEIYSAVGIHVYLKASQKIKLTK